MDAEDNGVSTTDFVIDDVFELQKLLAGENDEEMPEDELANELVKNKHNDKVKAINEFKLRVLDFIQIYILKQKNSTHTLQIMRGLLEALKVAYLDKTKMLIEKVKKCLLLLTKKQDIEASEENFANLETLVVELLSKLLKEKATSKDLNNAYKECFLSIIRILMKMQSEKADKLVKLSIKALLNSFFTKRNAVITRTFFEDFFSKNLDYSWKFFKLIVRRTLPKSKKGSRSQFQRLEAIALLRHIVKLSSRNESYVENIDPYYEYCYKVVINNLRMHDEIKNKKVNFLSQDINLFIQISRPIVTTNFDKAKPFVVGLIEEINQAIEKSPDLSTLKSKTGELKKLINNA